LDFWEAYDRIDPISIGSWHQTASVCHQVEEILRIKVPKYKGKKESDFLPPHAVREKKKIVTGQTPEEIEESRKAAERFAALGSRTNGIH
jgi:hypothetical protein